MNLAQTDKTDLCFLQLIKWYEKVCSNCLIVWEGNEGFSSYKKWGGGGGQNKITLWNFGNLAFKWGKGSLIKWGRGIEGGTELVLCWECSSKNFDLPYFHYQQVNIHKYANEKFDRN